MGSILTLLISGWGLTVENFFENPLLKLPQADVQDTQEKKKNQYHHFIDTFYSTDPGGTSNPSS